jgi:amino acid transporter
MAVAAANADWLPPSFAELGRFGFSKPSREDDNGEGQGSDAPLNAILLNTIVSAIFIFLGDFRSLLTFNGLGEYTFFFLTVLGAVVLRFREPDLHRPYKPLLVIPIIFTLVSGFVLVRGAVFAPVPALVLVAVWAVGVVFYVVRRRHAARSRQVSGY